MSKDKRNPVRVELFLIGVAVYLLLYIVIDITEEIIWRLI